MSSGEDQPERVKSAEGVEAAEEVDDAVDESDLDFDDDGARCQQGVAPTTPEAVSSTAGSPLKSTSPSDVGSVTGKGVGKSSSGRGRGAGRGGAASGAGRGRGSRGAQKMCVVCLVNPVSGNSPTCKEDKKEYEALKADLICSSARRLTQ